MNAVEPEIKPMPPTAGPKTVKSQAPRPVKKQKSSMMRQQTGHVYRRNGWWVLRWRESLPDNGQLVRRQLAKRIEPVAPEHQRLKRPPQSVLDAAKKMLEPLNKGMNPEAAQTLDQFFENVYMPHLAETGKRPSTLASYRRHWQSNLRAYVGNRRLREFRTIDAQKTLNDIARHSRERNHEFKPNTLRRIKSVLSGMFTVAIQLGLLDPPNPVTEAKAPAPRARSRPQKCPLCGGPPDGETTFVYSLEQVKRMLSFLPEPARAMCAVAAYAGLRRSEIAGFSWENYDGSYLWVTQSVWEGRISDPKTEKSRAAVPVTPTLRQILDNWRMLCGNPATGLVFATSKGTPLSLNNVLCRVMKPIFKKVGICWHGWHAFRRELASELHADGVSDKVNQSILRHSDVSVTQRCYIKLKSQQPVAAMNRFDQKVMCAECAPAQPPTPAPVVN